MCGIAGILDSRTALAEREEIVRRMLGTIRHRGPDQFGLYANSRVTLGNARLSIVDLAGGQQPISNEDGTLWVVFNGEIFNHLELRAELEERGHRFSTHTDTEVIIHLFEEEGPACLHRFNGQFAIALWDARTQQLFLARDRLGVRPLFYTRVGGALLFGSEIKCLFADGRVRRELDPVSLGQVFTFWATLPPRTAFRDVWELQAGHYLLANAHGEMSIQSYWKVEFAEASAEERGPQSEISEERWIEEFRETLIDAVRIRLRADVPVGAYLSGGLDSSTIAAVVRRYTSNRLATFSIAFDDASFDESAFQLRMAKALGTEHQVVLATHEEIGRIFPEVVRHAETPLMRTAPAPMFLLSRLVRNSGYKVVLTGEGADEFLCGYDLFKESKIRRFWARRPDSRWRPLLLQRLYRDIPRLSQSRGAFLTAFFKDRLTDIECPWYSHLIRWRNTRRGTRLFSAAAREAMGSGADEYLQGWERPAGFARWGPTERAQYWEITTFMSPYLLSSQGDRMGMAHSVEGRFPFLDHRMVALANRLPSRLKLRGLRDKYILRAAARDWLPNEILGRSKRPYRAPIHRSFFGRTKLDYIDGLLSEKAVADAGLFEPAGIRQLVRRVESGTELSETDDMALAGVISTQLLHEIFVAGRPGESPLGVADDVKRCVQTADCAP
jgi:asparagine synthase (glutamine-hydrolysing)